jgi:predicted metal-dependent phosphoesterase TrpH
VEAVDLHLHSTASDGEAAPGDVARLAAAAGLSAIALTDHDTLAGVAEARDAATDAPLRVIAGCEFSVRAWWGELHLLGYFLPTDDDELANLLADQQTARSERATKMVARLEELGAAVSLDAVKEQAGRGSVGRPHVARALVQAGLASSVNDAFDRYFADGGPAFVPKPLAALESMTALVRRLGGVTSAAHLKERATRKTLSRLKDAGVDAVEVLHPSHDEGTASRISHWATEIGLLKSGGSDWHGRQDARPGRRSIGALRVPAEWLDRLEQLHGERIATVGSGP